MPLHQKETLADGLVLGIWKIEESEEQFQHILTPMEFSAACGQVHAPGRRLERCAVRALLRVLTGIQSEIKYEECGRPFIERQACRLSISHTKGWAAIALHPSRLPGIDIEHPSPRILRVREHVFNPSEMESLTEQAGPQDEEVFSTLYWCAKEAVFKIIGKAVYDYRHGINIPPFPKAKEGVFPVETPGYQENRVLTVSYKIEKDFVLAWSLR